MNKKTIKRLARNILGINKSFNLCSFYLENIFKDKTNYQLFLDIDNGKFKNEIFQLFVKEAGDFPLLCRSNTTDTSVLLSVFFGKYHEPSYYLGEKPVILDLGANNGYSMRHMKFVYPNAKIYGFEMDPSNAEIATKNNIFFKDDCIVANIAIWTDSGTVTYGGEGEESYLIDNTLKNSSNAKKMNSSTIKEIYTRFHLQKIDYIKMDIENAEYDIFQRELSWLDNVRCINIEVHNPSHMGFFFEKLKSKGFECRKHPRHWSSVEGINKNF